MDYGKRQARGWHEHFLGGLRLNVESVPRLPARIVRWVLDDPRKIPYLFVWRLDGRPVSGVGETVEYLRIVALPGGPPPSRASEEWVSISPENGVHAIRLHRRRLPRYGGEDVLLFCPQCRKPRRHLYAWAVVGSRVLSRPWHCRACQELRYASEGGALRIRSRSALARAFATVFGNRHERPEPWDPSVFSHPARAAAWLARNGDRSSLGRGKLR